MARFEGVDYFATGGLLSEEQRMIRDTVRQWVDDELMPVIQEAYIARRFPKEGEHTYSIPQEELEDFARYLEEEALVGTETPWDW